MGNVVFVDFMRKQRMPEWLGLLMCECRLTKLKEIGFYKGFYRRVR